MLKSRDLIFRDLCVCKLLLESLIFPNFASIRSLFPFQCCLNSRMISAMLVIFTSIQIIFNNSLNCVLHKKLDSFPAHLTICIFYIEVYLKTFSPDYLVCQSNIGEGTGLLRLHSTYRHDLKIYSSDEGRVQVCLVTCMLLPNL